MNFWFLIEIVLLTSGVLSNLAVKIKSKFVPFGNFTKALLLFLGFTLNFSLYLFKKSGKNLLAASISFMSYLLNSTLNLS